MMHMLGQTVFYQLTGDDAVRIGERRKRMFVTKQPGAGDKKEDDELQEGINRVYEGNDVKAGDVFPMVIVKVWGDSDTSAVNGRVLLDGTDVFWASSVLQGAEPRTWSTSPPRAEPVAQQPDDQE